MKDYSTELDEAMERLRKQLNPAPKKSDRMYTCFDSHVVKLEEEREESFNSYLGYQWNRVG